MTESTFLAWIFRMPLIKRWSLMYCHKSENIAEHSHQVAVIAYLLAVIDTRKFGGSLSPDRAATIALFHEIAETRTQDLSSPVKYQNPDMAKEFKRIEREAEVACLASLPEEFQADFADILIAEHVDPEYKQLVKAADILCAYIKTLDELKHHNYEFQHVKTNLDPLIERYRQDMPAFAYLVDTFMGYCTATLDKLYSCENS